MACAHHGQDVLLGPYAQHEALTQMSSHLQGMRDAIELPGARPASADELGMIALAQQAIVLQADVVGVDVRDRLSDPRYYYFFDKPADYVAASSRVPGGYGSAEAGRALPQIGILLQTEADPIIALSGISHETMHDVSARIMVPRLASVTIDKNGQEQRAWDITDIASGHQRPEAARRVGLNEAVTDMAFDSALRRVGQTVTSLAYGPNDILLHAAMRDAARNLGRQVREIKKELIYGELTADRSSRASLHRGMGADRARQVLHMPPGIDLEAAAAIADRARLPEASELIDDVQHGRPITVFS